MDELDETVLNLQQRQQRAMILRRYKQKIERAREVAKRRSAPEKNIKKRAYAQARQMVRRRVAGKRGAEYEKLGPTEKMVVDRMVEGRQKLIKKIALRLIPRIKQAEQQRLHSYMKGQALKNHGANEGQTVKEDFNNLFAESFPPVAERSMRKQPEETSDPDGRKVKGKLKGNIIQYSKFDEERMCKSSAYKAIAKKSKKSGISEEILGEVYDRGMAAWTEECSVTQQQYAFARVNSYINQGKSYFNEDADLHELSTDTLKSYVSKSKADQDKSVFAYAYSMGHKQIRDKGEYKKNADRKARNRKQGVLNATDRIMQREETELEEARPVNNPEYDATEKAWNERKKDFDKNSKDGKYMPPKKTNEAFSNWTFEMKKGDKTKVVTGDHKGKRGTVVAKHDGGAVYSIKHDDGTVMKHHISTLVEPIKEDTEMAEGREPGKAYVKRQKRNDGSTMIVSSTKWGHKKFWRDAPSAIEKAKAHAQVDKIDEEGNVESDPKKRLVGTDDLVKAYKKDTPGQGGDLNESFNIAFAAGVGVTLTAADLGMKAQGGFALHPSVIEEMEEIEAEEVTETVYSGTAKAVTVPAHTVVGKDGQSISIPAKAKLVKTRKVIVNPKDNPFDGK